MSDFGMAHSDEYFLVPTKFDDNKNCVDSLSLYICI
jgi:hypothetical protein